MIHFYRIGKTRETWLENLNDLFNMLTPNIDVILNPIVVMIDELKRIEPNFEL